MTPSLDEFKISPNLYVPPSPINVTTMISQHTKFPPTTISQEKPAHRAFHWPTAKAGPISLGSITNPMLITGYDTNLTPESPGVW